MAYKTVEIAIINNSTHFSLKSPDYSTCRGNRQRVLYTSCFDYSTPGSFIRQAGSDYAGGLDSLICRLLNLNI